jgi:ribosomal subunit interface protein
MPEGSPVVVHFKEVSSSQELRTAIEERCERFTAEFHEVTRFEITFSPLGSEVSAHGHATGKNTNVATHASGANLRAAADQVLEKIERQLRKVHDKRIFSMRREAQRNRARRNAAN